MKSILDTAQNLMTLGLHGMAVAYERQLETPALLKEPFDTRLGLMMDAENSERESRKVGRLLKAARLRENEATMDSIEFKASRG
ncbi:MAG: ATP-binding protein, partial [Alphaproteobacteria bacterium]|nr:ATP-binding protein [Alphaproteobacteria bacterium]